MGTSGGRLVRLVLSSVYLFLYIMKGHHAHHAQHWTVSSRDAAIYYQKYRNSPSLIWSPVTCNSYFAESLDDVDRSPRFVGKRATHHMEPFARYCLPSWM